ncbi:MAG: 2Fe-2S iron-sulfur cluster binding domain-containing protein [Pseudomonadales bacterium]|nr:2Fe-2S iron-sulfur cluster binding domain-containing protein [Pseudomonadales bacterium]
MGMVRYIESNGTVHEIDVKNGTSLMQAAVTHMVPGIEGDCGGACACATCHVYIDPEWRQKCAEMDPLELAVLDFAWDVNEDSRLCCQITMSEELDGITLRIAERQY